MKHILYIKCTTLIVREYMRFILFSGKWLFHCENMARKIEIPSDLELVNAQILYCFDSLTLGHFDSLII